MGLITEYLIAEDMTEKAKAGFDIYEIALEYDCCTSKVKDYLKAYEYLKDMYEQNG